ncbi:efflux RND transporter periplasmic adaptor subunit [Rurimicrobium arvi]|uniref:Efflux RND transporter periplasmic adaptor subunit n=1 Tax=Rurimicrobium arvi TaxID=2049916 RepID=A0ABP8MNG8_9BACT
MQTRLIHLGIIAGLFFSACHSPQKDQQKKPSDKPVVTENGAHILLPDDTATTSFFKVSPVLHGNENGAFVAPARVVATVVRSRENPDQNLVLFDNPDLTANYTALLQHVMSIRQHLNIVRQKNAIASQKEIEVSRFSDLAAHGAGTGKEVADAKTDLISAETEKAVAETELANEKTGIIEHEARLKLAGFDPESLIHADLGKVWLICEIPETFVTKVQEGNSCTLFFTAFPDTSFTGTIEDVGEVIDNITRMVKLRIGMQHTGYQLRAGMFAQVQFGVSEGNVLSVPRSAVVTVQGKQYVFVRENARSYIRKPVTTGPQIGEHILVYDGLQTGDQVVTEGTMQLKGISFGY